MTHYACRSVRPGQELANGFEFLGKKIRIPTRGWARTASPEQANKRGNPDCRRPTSTLGSIIRPNHRQAGEQIRHPRLKGHHPDYDLLWPAGRSGPGRSPQTGLNFGGRRSESQQEVGHVRRARSRSTKEEIQTAAGQPRRWGKIDRSDILYYASYK